MGRRGTISKSVAFRELGKARKSKTEAKMKYSVHIILKDGSVGKVVYKKTITKKEADERAKDMMKMNPGDKFVVKKLK